MKAEMLSDEMLDSVVGGVGPAKNSGTYDLDNDPLFKRFSSLMDGEKKKNGVTGMESRAEFINLFRKWMKDGMPDQVKLYGTPSET